jgi:hypothetical protein
MTTEDRIRFLLRVARRTEGEGDPRAASAFRRMADEARPIDPGSRASQPKVPGSGVD